MTPDLVSTADKLNFRADHQLALPRAMTAMEAWRIFMAVPLPGMGLALRLRDAISGLFGVRPLVERGTAPGDDAPARAMEQIGFFEILRNDPDCLTMVQRDRHLDVMICATTEAQTLRLTASVKVHNWFGHIYMIPVAPAHRLIVRRMLRRMARVLKGG